MTVILDENLPKGLLRVLVPRTVTTVQQAGYSGVKNGQLMTLIDGVYDVLVTGDKNLRYQQNLAGRQIAIVELPTNRWPLLRRLESQIIEAVDGYTRSSYTIVAAA